MPKYVPTSGLSLATSIGTKRALARIPRCTCHDCYCKRMLGGFGQRKQCWKCARGEHIRKMKIYKPDGSLDTGLIRYALTLREKRGEYNDGPGFFGGEVEGA